MPNNHQISIFSLLSSTDPNNESNQPPPQQQRPPSPPRSQYPNTFKFVPQHPEQQQRHHHQQLQQHQQSSIVHPKRAFFDPIKDTITNSNNVNASPPRSSGKMSLFSMMNNDTPSDRQKQKQQPAPTRSKLIINDLLLPDDGPSPSAPAQSKTSGSPAPVSAQETTTAPLPPKRGRRKNATKTTSEQPKKRGRKKQTTQANGKSGKNQSANQQPNPNLPAPMKMLPKPTFMDVIDPSTGAKLDDQLAAAHAKGGKGEIDGEKFEPIIALHIPLVPPGTKPGQSQAIFNVMKLCEDKYGFNVMHPNGRIAFDFDAFDDDDDEAFGNGKGKADGQGNNNNEEIDYENDDQDGILKKLKLKFTPGMSDDQKEDMILKELHRRKMENNKRIGKYDINDPFIDDEELLFEEQTKTNKDGFFVYYGPMVDENANNNNNGSKKATRKRNNNGDGSAPKRRRNNKQQTQAQNSCNGNGNSSASPMQLAPKENDGFYYGPNGSSATPLLTASGRPRKKPGPKSKKEKEALAAMERERLESEKSGQPTTDQQQQQPHPPQRDSKEKEEQVKSKASTPTPGPSKKKQLHFQSPPSGKNASENGAAPVEKPKRKYTKKNDKKKNSAGAGKGNDKDSKIILPGVGAGPKNSGIIIGTFPPID
ncbi:unnamed protein product [Ambrosiozyma monospora]|uniref:Unnamed protein product n=1 Tax=Ambrosiozyma monospora TaxID=43982 RepID=A0ACB5SUP3_AMBMO|nr:unnamed protein product [Ambrosiozyma monospora]